MRNPNGNCGEISHITKFAFYIMENPYNPGEGPCNSPRHNAPDRIRCAYPRSASIGGDASTLRSPIQPTDQ
jgi:hypothetical protein